MDGSILSRLINLASERLVVSLATPPESAVALFIEGCHRVSTLFAASPSEGSPWTYVVRLFAFPIILCGILYKNYGMKGNG